MVDMLFSGETAAARDCRISDTISRAQSLATRDLKKIFPDRVKTLLDLILDQLPSNKCNVSGDSITEESHDPTWHANTQDRTSLPDATGAFGGARRKDCVYSSRPRHIDGDVTANPHFHQVRDSIRSTWSCYWLDQFLTLALNILILSIFYISMDLSTNYFGHFSGC